MNRFRSTLLLSLAALLTACGTPSGTTQHGAGGTEVLGPDADGRFYVVGLAGDVLPNEQVTVRNAAGESVVVSADETGSWAAMLWSEITDPVSIESSTAVVESAASAPQKINVNYASRRGLESLPGIGDSLANAIIYWRGNHGLFENPEDLTKVPGIGSTSIQAFLPYVETKIDVNSASKEQLTVLPAIGAARAAAIIAWRQANGPFEQVSDLMLVDGITASIYAGIERFVAAGEVSTHPAATLVNVNRATIEELRTLPGIGEAKAKAVTDYRVNHGAFHAKEDLLFVPGIGQTTFAAIRDLVTVGVLDPKVGTFVAEGSWQYDDGYGNTTSAAFPKPVLVKFDRSTQGNELIVTFVGGGYCDPAADCAPFSLKGTIASDSSDGSFSYRLSGLMPSEAGSFVVTASAETEGRVSETEILTSLVAVRGYETYRLALTGYRVIQ